jgi:hypothetical protein
MISLLKSGTLDMNVIAPNGIANVGDKIHYQFTVTNTGNVTLTNVIVTDPIVTVSGGPITLSPGATDNTTFTGEYILTQADIDAGRKDNTATTTGKDPQNISVSASDDETTWIPKNAMISLLKSGTLDMNVIAPNGIANVGDKIHYQFTVTNTGNVTLTNVIVTDPIVTVSGGPITLSPGATDNTTFTGEYILTQTDIDAGRKDNTATTRGKDPQNISVSASDDETTWIPASPKIILEKSGVWIDNNGDGYANVGEAIHYQFKVCNTGNVTLTNVSVTDPLVTIIGGPIPVLNVGVCNSLSFSGTYLLTQLDIDSGKVVNVATAKGFDPKGNPVTDLSDDPKDLTNQDPDYDGDPDDPTITLLPQNPKIGVAKKLVNVKNNLDGTFTSTFEITVSNNGNVTLGDVQVLDNLSIEFGNLVLPYPLNPGEYTVNNLGIVNSIDPLTLNSGFNGQTDIELLNVVSGGTIKIGESVKIHYDLIFKPSKYSYFNQAIATADKPGNDDPVNQPDNDPEDTRDLSDSGSNESNNPNTGGNNPGEPGDKGTVDDPTLIIIPASQLKGKVWNDLDGNGVQDLNEYGMSGVEAWLYSCDGTLIKKDTTDFLGKYQFDFLQTPMDYYVVYKPGNYLPDFGFTLPNVGMDDSRDSDADLTGKGPCRTLGVYEKDSTRDAGLVLLSAIGDYVWDDLDGDGIQTNGEKGIANVKVTLYDASTDTIIKSIFTDSTGFYLFKYLLPLDYYLKFDLPVGSRFTIPNQGSDFNDSDVDNSNGPNTTATTHLSPGEIDRTFHAGIYKCASISGDVWYDLDMDGIYDPEEKGINGLKVFIIDASNGSIVNTMITSVKPGTVSDDGYYKADCLKPGKYIVNFERPGDLGASAPYQGSNPYKDSDVTHENGVNTTRELMIQSGEAIVGISGGFQIKSVLGDKVWIDKNFNGIQDSGEPPLTNVKVAAYNSKGLMVSESQTGSDGKFILDGMTQGNFYVKFNLPGQKYGFTVPHAGDDDIDSDVDGTNGYGTTKMYIILPGEVRPSIDAGVVSQVLAIEWLRFEGRLDNNFVALNWTSGIEEDNDHFVIERRFESENDFAQIGIVAASSLPALLRHDYEFNDLDIDKSGIYYYRLKQISLDGTYNYSKIISIRVNSVNEQLKAVVFPNPVSDFLNFELWIPEDTELEWNIFDSSGKMVKQSSMSQVKKRGKYSERINVIDFIPGNYTIQIKSSNGVIHQKISVIK